MQEPLLPDDQYNRELVHHAHPPDWVNPTPKGRYQLVVIGSGTAGLTAAAGVRSDERGVQVDDFLQTSDPRIFAAGDVASPFQFTHTANALGRMAMTNALFLKMGRASRMIVPWRTDTDPEIAHAGNLRTYFTMLMGMGKGLSALASPISPYPAQSEILRKISGLYLQTKLTPTVKRFLSAFLSWRR